jgi:hypothetical protein
VMVRPRGRRREGSCGTDAKNWAVASRSHPLTKLLCPEYSRTAGDDEVVPLASGISPTRSQQMR